MTPLLEQFIQETREMLEQAANGLLALDRDLTDADLLNRVFRSVHTIKGAAGLFEFTPLIRVLHAGEDLLDRARSGELQLDPATIDLLLESLDRVSAWIDAIEADQTLPPQAATVADHWAGQLRALMGETKEVAPVAEAAVEAVDLPLDWLDRLAEEHRLAAYRADTPLWALVYRPDEQCFFKGEDPFHLVRSCPQLLGLVIGSREPWPALDELDPYRCVLEFALVSAASRQDLEEHFQYVLPELTLAPLAPRQLVRPVGRPSSDPVVADFVQDARQLAAAGDWVGLKTAAVPLGELLQQDLWPASCLRWLQALLASQPQRGEVEALLASLATGRAPDWPASGAPVEAAPQSPAEPRESPTEDCPAHRAFLELVTEQLKILDLPMTGEPHEAGRLASVARVMGNALRFLGRDEPLLEQSLAEAGLAPDPEPLRQILITLLPGQPDEIAPEPLEAPPPVEPAMAESAGVMEEARTAPPALSRVLKIDQARIDKLMDLIAELVVAKNGLPYLARAAEQRFGVRELAREVKDHYGVIDRITQELQGAVMEVRMLPVGNIFQRFPRLVRDTARKLGKQIELVMEGEDTEADKNVIEVLSEPLIHLLRNSMDHGLETPGEREAVGKPPTGTVRIRACNDNDSVVIEIADDGRGIDPERVKLKAYERGLLDEARLGEMSDEEAVQLIFAPGLSTAEAVSDLSGRGVGMDAVRSAIERVGGSVWLSSRRGEGTLVRLSLPLSMAVTQVMAVEAGDQLWGIPINLVAETVRIRPDSLRRIKRQEVFMLRDQVVPLVRLHKLLELPISEKEPEELAVLVARVNGSPVGLVVDRFREGMETILRPLEGVLAGIRAFSGTALLGDGSVLLVLNLKELLSGH